MSLPLLAINDLQVEARTKQPQSGWVWQEILKGVDANVDRGEVLGLIGESGAGKSTLGLAAMGHVRRGCRISGGEILLDGVGLQKADPIELRSIRGRKVAYVAQSAAAAFNPAHTILKQVLEVTRIHGDLDRSHAREQAIHLFDRMALPDPGSFGNRYPHEVSGGQLQRAMTAMALAGRPDLIIFDEPTTALDVTTQIEVLAIIREAVREVGAAALYISHDLAVVAQIADRIKVLRNGVEIEEQSTIELLNSPRDSYTKALLSVRSSSAKQSDVSTMPILEVCSVSAAYGSTQVLYDVDLSVHRGRNLAIVGESGSGKSTLARVICGLLPPLNGKLTFNGVTLSPGLRERDAEARRRIQLIYQNPDVAMNPRHKIADIIGRPARVFGHLKASQAMARTCELLELVGLSANMVDRYPGQLSGGQKQRVCIARALAAEPDLVICDEVTSALDPLIADGIIELLLKLQGELGVAYIFITHDMTLVRAIADEVTVLKNGYVVETGSCEEIFLPPHTDYTELLISSTPKMEIDWLDTLLAHRDSSGSENLSRNRSD